VFVDLAAPEDGRTPRDTATVHHYWNPAKDFAFQILRVGS
jgi:hypothetical protein